MSQGQAAGSGIWFVHWPVTSRGSWGLHLPPVPNCSVQPQKFLGLQKQPVPSHGQGRRRGQHGGGGSTPGGGGQQQVQAEQLRLQPLRARPLRRKRNNNRELAKNEFFPYKKGGTFPHSQ